MATAQDSTDDTVDAVLDMERMLTIARTIVWMLLLLEMAVPPAPRFRAMQLLRFCLRGSSGNSELGWELGFGTHFWNGNWDSSLQTCAEILQICTMVQGIDGSRDLHTNREEDETCTR